MIRESVRRSRATARRPRSTPIMNSWCSSSARFSSNTFIFQAYAKWAGIGVMMVLRDAMLPTENDATIANNEVWPALPQVAWSDTCATLQLWMQMVGKVRMELTPAINHSWNVTLYPTVLGLTTGIMAHGTRTLQIEFDFIEHLLVVETSEGTSRTIPLKPM